MTGAFSRGWADFLSGFMYVTGSSLRSTGGYGAISSQRSWTSLTLWKTSWVGTFYRESKCHTSGYRPPSSPRSRLFYRAMTHYYSFSTCALRSYQKHYTFIPSSNPYRQSYLASVRRARTSLKWELSRSHFCRYAASIGYCASVRPSTYNQESTT